MGDPSLPVPAGGIPIRHQAIPNLPPMPGAPPQAPLPALPKNRRPRANSAADDTEIASLQTKLASALSREAKADAFSGTLLTQLEKAQAELFNSKREIAALKSTIQNSWKSQAQASANEEINRTVKAAIDSLLAYMQTQTEFSAQEVEAILRYIQAISHYLQFAHTDPGMTLGAFNSEEIAQPEDGYPAPQSEPGSLRRKLSNLASRLARKKNDGDS